MNPTAGADNWRRAVVYALLAGTLATFIHGYYFGRINHVEQLPQILRAMDHSYLTRDFALNATTGYGPRFFYTRLLAFLGRVFGLPAVFLVLTCLQNAAVALVTYFAARRLLAGSQPAAVAACVLVLAVRSVKLGEADYLVLPGLIPASLVTAPALLAVWFGLRGRPLAAALVALPAVLIHPLLGLLCGGLGIATAGIAEPRKALRAGLVLAGFALLGGLLWVVPASRGGLSARQLLDIYARFRAPHHILPSRFPPADYLALGAFLAAVTIAGRRLFRAGAADAVVLRRLPILAGLLLALWLAGYVFVEVVPTRIGITMQAFRLTLVVKWLGLMLLAGAAVRQLEGGEPASGALTLAGTGAGQPWTALVAAASPRFGPLTPALVFAVALLLQSLLGFSVKELHALVALGLLSVIYHALKRPAWRYPVTALAVLLWVGLIVVNRDHRLPLIGGLLARSAPTLRLEEAADGERRAVAFCRAALPPDAVVLTPPDLGSFRLTAQRAIVVDFKYAVPLDSGMLEWRQRLEDCYGPVTGSGWNAAAEMDRNYRQITDSRVLMAGRRYGATHALLYGDTRTALPVLYRDAGYQLVAVVPVVSVLAFRVSNRPLEDPDAWFAQLKDAAGVNDQLGDAYYLLVDGPVTVAAAEARYHEAVAAGRLPELGDLIQTWTGSGPDRVPVTALFFAPSF